MSVKTESRGRGRGVGRFSQYKSAPYPGYAPGAGINFAEDSITFGLRQQYTNFESRPRTRRQDAPAEGKRPESEWAKVIRPLPDGLETKIIKVDPEAVVCFHGRAHWLSNFYKGRVVVDGNLYPSVEHYYQACKLYMLAGPYHSSQIRRIPDPGSVKVATRRILRSTGISDEEVEEWKINEGPRILEYGMMHKFVQDEDLRSKLLGTGSALLVHAFPNDKVFAAGMDEEGFAAWAKANKDLNLAVPLQLSTETIPYFPKFGDGKNIEGLICMRVREEIRRFVGDIEKRKRLVMEKHKNRNKKAEAVENEAAGPEEAEEKAEDDLIKEDMNAGLISAMASLSIAVQLPPPRPKPTGPFFKSKEEGQGPEPEPTRPANAKPKNPEEGHIPPTTTQLATTSTKSVPDAEKPTTKKASKKDKPQ